MAADATQILGGAAVGALITAVVGPTVSQRGARRDVRADVLRRVAEVESTRWAGESYPEFRTAIIHLRAAALVAVANRRVVDRYLRLANVARRQSERNFDPDSPEVSGGIPPEISDLVLGAATILTESLWHPYRKRWSVSRQLRTIEDRERALRDSKEGQTFDWSEPRF
jgi:hypothetical protein